MKPNDPNSSSGRDAELDTWLAPLRATEPDDAMVSGWSQALSAAQQPERMESPSRSRRWIEWAIAASIGFVLATAWHAWSKQAPLLDDSGSWQTTGVDATEMQLVANQE